MNPHHGTARNPYNPAHYTGGSSSGPAAAVASGLCPIAIGADGGGSIRIPSSFCGVVGLKSTFGRFSEFGAAPLCWSVSHLGPLAASVADAALGYAVMAGPDPREANSLRQPLPTLQGWDNPDIKGLRIGVYWPWFRHASAEVVTACEALLKQFEGLGAQICEVAIPDLEAARVAHVITIAGEMAQAMDCYHIEHYKQHGLDVRLNLALARAFTTLDYVKSQQVRTRLIANFKHAFETVDVIVTPSTGLAAPLIPASALPDGDFGPDHPDRDHALCHARQPDRAARHLLPRRLHARRPAGRHAGHRPPLGRSDLAAPGSGCRGTGGEKSPAGVLQDFIRTKEAPCKS